MVIVFICFSNRRDRFSRAFPFSSSGGIRKIFHCYIDEMRGAFSLLLPLLFSQLFWAKASLPQPYFGILKLLEIEFSSGI